MGRRRRVRLAWAAGLVAVAGIVLVFALLLPSPESNDLPVRQNDPAVVQRDAPTVRFTAKRRAEVRRVLDEFVATAVARRRLPRSYDLATPALREGMSRAEWAKGDIPVYPFPAARQRVEILQVLTSHPHSVLLDVSVVPRPGADVGVSDFTTELREVGRGAARRWLVESFNPLRINPKAPVAAPAEDTPAAQPAQQTEPISNSKLSTRWLLVPLSILALIVITPVALGITEWWRTRRAERRAGARRELPPLPSTRDRS